MKVIKTLKPGEQGTRHLLNKYGDRLVCVRYRNGMDGAQRYTTVELVVDSRPVAGNSQPWKAPPRDNTRIAKIRVGYHETELRERLRAIGGKWNPEEKCWNLAWEHVEREGLQARIVM